MSGVASPWPSGGHPPVNAFDPDLQVRRADFGDDGWAVWTHQSEGVQRAILYFRGIAPAGVATGYRVGADMGGDNVEDVARQQLRRYMLRSPTAGMAFGIILELPQPLLSTAALLGMVDGYQDDTGSLQWVVQAELAKQRVQGARTWASGYLMASYDGLLLRYKRMGFHVAQQRKERRR